MAPQVEQAAAEGEVLVQEAVGQVHQLGIVVVAGGTQAQPVLRHGEIVGGVHRAAVQDAAGAQGIHHLVVIGAEGIGHAADDAAEFLLQVLAVLGNLVHDLVGGAFHQGGMGQAVDSHLMLALAVEQLGLAQRHAAVDGALRVLRALGGPAAGVEVEGALQAVQVQDGDQLRILLHAVVIAEGQGLSQAARKTHEHNRFLLMLPVMLVEP